MRAYIVSLSADTIKDNIVLLVRQRIYTPELRMEICAVIRDVGQRVVYLIVHYYIAVICVFERYSRALFKRHMPVAVNAVERITTDSKRIDKTLVVCGRMRKKITYGAFDRRLFTAVPVHTQNKIAECSERCYPDMRNSTGSVYLSESKGLSALYRDRRGYLPLRTELAKAAPVPSVAIPPFPFSPVKFSGDIEREQASDRCTRSPRFDVKPLNIALLLRK